MTEAVLPRARARRRRPRRPLGPLERAALVLLFVGLASIPWAVFALLRWAVPQHDVVGIVGNALVIAVAAYYVWLAWPVVREWLASGD